MKALTTCQQDALRFIREYCDTNFRPPTVREIANHFGITVKAAQERITALRKKNYLAPSDSSSRSFRILIDIDEAGKIEPELVHIPLLGQVAAGKPLLCEDNIEKYLSVPETMLRKNHEYFALRVKGNSMVDAGIWDGDTALIQQCETAENGEIIVAVLDDSATLKRFFKEPSRIRLQPENPDFKPIYCQDVRIAGKLAAIFRTY